MVGNLRKAYTVDTGTVFMGTVFTGTVDTGCWSAMERSAVLGLSYYMFLEVLDR